MREFPCFGLKPFANRIPDDSHLIELKVGGEVGQPICLSDELGRLPRVEQTSDFHCVTTWSYCSLNWSGYRFIDFYEQIVIPQARPEHRASFVVFSGLDGYSASLPLDDLLRPRVILADRLEGKPLPLKHGAPLRLIALAHYGYKNAKHLCAIDFWRDNRKYRPIGYSFMDHPRARVDFEERGRGLPGWVFRYLYRPLVGPTTKAFKIALAKHNASNRGMK